LSNKIMGDPVTGAMCFMAQQLIHQQHPNSAASY
jgi:hypothetical protein